MDTPHAPGNDAPLTGTIVVETRTVRRPLTRSYWLVAAAVPLMLTIGIGVSRGPGIEQALKKDVQRALANADVKNVGVSVNGRMVTAEVPTGVDAEKIKNLVAEVDGVSAVSAKLVYASYAEARDCANLQDKLDRATHKQRIPFAGDASKPTSEGTAMLRDAAKILDDCGTAVVYVGGHTDPSTRYGSTISLERAKLMTKLLKSYGVDSEQLEPRGYGDQFPIDKSGKAAGRARNERGSIIVRSQ
jgi:outer membrane protein OmpA-like peptidoglycan-associated protein